MKINPILYIRQIKAKLNKLRYFLPLWQRINWFDLLILSSFRHGKRDNSDLVCIRLRYPSRRSVFIREKSNTDKSVFKYVFFNAYHHPPITLKEKCTILDLGANIGLTMVDFKECYPHSRILGFEMDAQNFTLAQKNIVGLTDCVIENKAIWHTKSTVQYAIDVAEDAYNISDAKAIDIDTRKYRQVEALSMNDVLSQYNLSEVDYVKMDIEGAEKALLQNGSRTWLNHINCLNIEIHDPSFLPEAMTILESFNFDCYKDTNHWSAILAIKTHQI